MGTLCDVLSGDADVGSDAILVLGRNLSSV